VKESLLDLPPLPLLGLGLFFSRAYPAATSLRPKQKVKSSTPSIYVNNDSVCLERLLASAPWFLPFFLAFGAKGIPFWCLQTHHLPYLGDLFSLCSNPEGREASSILHTILSFQAFCLDGLLFHRLSKELTQRSLLSRYPPPLNTLKPCFLHSPSHFFFSH